MSFDNILTRMTKVIQACKESIPSPTHAPFQHGPSTRLLLSAFSTCPWEGTTSGSHSGSSPQHRAEELETVNAYMGQHKMPSLHKEGRHQYTSFYLRWPGLFLYNKPLTDCGFLNTWHHQ